MFYLSKIELFYLMTSSMLNQQDKIERISCIPSNCFLRREVPHIYDRIASAVKDFLYSALFKVIRTPTYL